MSDEKQIIHDLALIVVQHHYAELMKSSQGKDISYSELMQKLAGYYASAVKSLRDNTQIINSAYDDDNSSPA